MKKTLIGLAAGALAVSAFGTGSASAAAYTVYDSIIDNGGIYDVSLAIDASGLDAKLADCGNLGDNNGLPEYTIFFPADTDLNPGPVTYTYYDAVIDKLLTALDITEGQLYTQPSLIASFLKNHIVLQNIAPVQLESDANTVFNTWGGLTLHKTKDVYGSYYINGYYVDTSGDEACNGWVYDLDGALAPVTAKPTTGTTTDGSVTQSAAAGSGLPKTGSESMALTFAALASLIAGAGVLVIRRRSVA